MLFVVLQLCYVVQADGLDRLGVVFHALFSRLGPLHLLGLYSPDQGRRRGNHFLLLLLSRWSRFFYFGFRHWFRRRRRRRRRGRCFFFWFWGRRWLFFLEGRRRRRCLFFFFVFSHIVRNGLQPFDRVQVLYSLLDLEVGVLAVLAEVALVALTVSFGHADPFLATEVFVLSTFWLDPVLRLIDRTVSPYIVVITETLS